LLQHLFGRRKFLEWSAAIPLTALALPPDEELVPFTDYGREFRIEAQADNPRVKCFDLRRLASWTTPSGDFFAFHQTDTVHADAGDWRLRIGGLVRRPAEFSLQDLLNRTGRRDLAVTIECSGNSGDSRLMNGLVSNCGLDRREPGRGSQGMRGGVRSAGSRFWGWIRNRRKSGKRATPLTSPRMAAASKNRTDH
jgi:hypothetical protein